jgi:DNA polymerase I-like protein with 3'-5' exonuclease and polymerase domains
MTSYAILDTETTISHKGNPFDSANKLCAVGVKCESLYAEYAIEYDIRPYGDSINRIVDTLNRAEQVVAFNAKFDLHWIKNYSNEFNVSDIWDCQLAAYLLSGQTKIYPSLEECLGDAGLGSKLDVVKLEYWDKGIDTPNIPWGVLSEYLRQDVFLTDALYQYQREQFRRQPELFKLFRVSCADLLCLLDAERNGLRYNTNESIILSKGVREDIARIDNVLTRLWPYDFINWGSHDHLSILLFGGSIYTTGRETYERTLKSGEVKQYERNCWVPNTFPKLIEPDPKTESVSTEKISEGEFEALNLQRAVERKKPLVRCYSTEEGILKNYHTDGLAKETIDLLLKRSELVKLASTYYEGIPSIIEEYGWPKDRVHGTFQQVTTRTGRLSSKQPNLQNFAGLIKPLFYTEFS